VTDSREQFDMITELTIQGKARLRALGVSFAQAPYAESGTAERRGLLTFSVSSFETAASRPPQDEAVRGRRCHQ